MTPPSLRTARPLPVVPADLLALAAHLAAENPLPAALAADLALLTVKLLLRR